MGGGYLILTGFNLHRKNGPTQVSINLEHPLLKIIFLSLLLVQRNLKIFIYEYVYLMNNDLSFTNFAYVDQNVQMVHNMLIGLVMMDK